MLVIRINKWILSLAILASLAAFSGYTESQVKTAYNRTELVVENPISKRSVYYFSSLKNSSNSIIDFYKFSFQSLIRNYNLTIGLQIKTSNFNCLQYISTCRFQELINSLRQDDDYNIFIG